jgi:hypothetical protein
LLDAAVQEVLRDSVHYDIQLFDEALEHFKARAERYDCPLVA